MSDKNQTLALGELKDHTDPLLEKPGMYSPKGSLDGSDKGRDLHIPDSKVKQADDTVSGFTAADYMNPQKVKVFKNHNQQQLDDFLRHFSEEAGSKANERTEGGNYNEMPDSDISDGMVQKSDSQSAKNKLSKILKTIQAPDDATKTNMVQNHQAFYKSSMKIVNPRSTYFDLSRKFFKAKYPDGDNKKIIKVKSFLETTDKKKYLRNLSMDIIQTQQGNMPVIKTYEANAYDETKFVKAVKFYDYRKDCKLLEKILIDEGWMDDTYRTFDVSTLHFGNCVLFYQRQERWLQLQCYDVITNTKKEMPYYQIEMPNKEDIRYHPIFSKQFGQTTKNVYEKSAKNFNQQLSEFLDQQFVFCQEYKLNDKQTYETKKLKMFSMNSTDQPIEQYGGEMDDLPEAIQYIAHIQQKNEEGVYYSFVAIDPFSTHIFQCPENRSYHTRAEIFPGNNEVQLQNIQDLKDPQYSSQWKHDHLTPFYIHQNPQFIIQCDTVNLDLTEKNLTVEQYYYMTNDSQFMLVYPNYDNLAQKNQVIFQLAKKYSYTSLVHDDDYEYMDDFLQRKQDFETNKYKKIAHVCYDNSRSKNHMKNADHLRRIIEYPVSFQMNHRLILSTDQERSNIYVYQSKDVEGLGQLPIEIYNYENNIAKAQSLDPKLKLKMLDGEEQAEDTNIIPKLPKQVAKLMQEEEKYAKKLTSKKAEADMNCYYMNANFKNVLSSRYCIQTQSPTILNSKVTINHCLPVEEHKRFCLVDGLPGHQEYCNIRIKHDHMNEDVELQMYFRSKDYYVFLFTLVNEAEKYDRKQSFFFIRKDFDQIEELSQDNHKSLISLDQQIWVVQDNDLLGPDEIILQKYLKIMVFRQLCELQRSEKQDHHLNLTMETLYDFKSNLDFLPFIYQEKKSLASHHLLVLDINSMEIVGKTCINSNLQIRQYLRKSIAGYAQYTLTRTSDKFDQKTGYFAQGKVSQVVKYQISHQYYLEDADEHPNPAKCTIELSEYIVNYINQASKTKINLIGRKQMLLSDVAQFRREQSFDKLFILPYFDRTGKIKGSQLVLKEDNQVIKITDQDKNNIYHHETELVQFGQQKFLTDKGSHEEFILIVSAQLKQKVYMKGNLEASEAYYILNKIQKKIMSMQLAKFEYFVLTDDFDKLMRDEFYQSQEVLEGKTICDICLNFPKEIAAGLRLNELEFKQIDGSMIHEITQGDQKSIDFYKKIQLCEDNLIIQPDFNFVTTLRLGIELGANQSVKLLLNRVFKLNRRDYQECLMLDLPKLLDSDMLNRIYPFLERDHDEYLKIVEDQENIHIDNDQINAQFCNFEDYIIHPKLPPFSKKQVSYHVMQDFIDHHNTQQELLCEVILKDPYMQWDVHNYNDEMAKHTVVRKPFEVEHSLIDFQKLIIGEKIRGYQEEFKNIEFNDQHLAKLLYKEEDKNIQFYKLETVQKLIDFQFEKTQQFLGLIMRLYVFGFVGPFILSITFDNYLLKNLCYILCFVTQGFLFLFELVQMRQYGKEYIMDFWNCIDLMQFGAFIYLFISKLLSQFNSDSFFEILLSAGILFLSINKMLYFVRIYDGINEMLTMIQCIIGEILPFASTSILLIFALSKIYHVLHMGVNDPDGYYKNIDSNLMKLFMQTIKLSTGDKTPPTFDDEFSRRLKGSDSKIIYIFFLESVWALQQVLSFSLGLYATAKSLSTYEKTMQILELLIFRSKAKLNEENFQILNLIQRQAPFKVIFFQIDKDLKKNKLHKFEGVSRSIEKILVESDNRKSDMKKDDDNQRKQLLVQQRKTQEKLDDMMRELRIVCAGKCQYQQLYEGQQIHEQN